MDKVVVSKMSGKPTNFKRGHWVRFRTVSTAILLAFGLAIASRAGGQSAQRNAPPSPTFEVASIKLNRSSEGGTSMRWGGNRFSASGLTTKQLIEFAYDIKDSQLSGGPSWINSEKYDVEAKVDESIISELEKLAPTQRQEQGNKQTRLMLQSLLAERFNLKVVSETKELPIYALVVAKNGPKIKPAELPPPSPDGTPAPKPRGWGGLSSGEGKITLTGRPIRDLVDVLSRMADTGDRIVLDETGLNGDYILTLQWTPESMTAAGSPDASQVSTAPPPPPALGPSLFTAIQEQLGLKLEPRRGPVETFVIAHLQRPSEN